jgi:hypothetical protein
MQKHCSLPENGILVFILPSSVLIQPVIFHLEQPSSFNSQGGTYFNMPKKKSYNYKKRTDKDSKNTKKQISLGHTITEYANLLTSSHTQNTISNSINSEE